MDLEKEVALYDAMTDVEDQIESLQTRIYDFGIIPIEVRDELSKQLYEVRMRLLDYSNDLGGSLVVMGAFD